MHRLLARHAEFVGEGSYQGRLFKVDYYPGVISSDQAEDRVRGEVYRLRKPTLILEKLDAYEACGPGFPEPTEYVRSSEWITLRDGGRVRAWIYLYNHPTSGLRCIASGDFFEPEN